MSLSFASGRDLIFVDKPYAINTHAADKGKLGFAEVLERELDRKLWVVHRLDKTTTGCMAFATSAVRAEELRHEFAHQLVKKTYYFVTDRPSVESTGHIKSVLEPGTAPAETHFERVKRSPFYELWKATPLTGKTHQIRRHAAELGLPILGDTSYGGTNFPVLCLHAQRLELPGETPFETPLPRYFERLGVLRDAKLVGWLSQIDRRQRLYSFLSKREEILRLVDDADLILDAMADVVTAQWYPEDFTGRDENRAVFLSNLLGRPLLLRRMRDRGKDPNANLLFETREVPSQWEALENGTRYLMAKDRGLSFGLFVDQRKNRAWVREHAKDKRVLNLFAYTGGFSVEAAKGGASKVLTVDVSAKYVGWAKENFTINGLDTAPHVFTVADALDFLARGKKRQEKFDLIICDPPSFARVDGQVFKLEKELPNLLRACLDVLSPDGTFLFSCNLETWDEEVLLQKIRGFCPGWKVQKGQAGLDSWWPEQPSSMKSYLLSKS